MEYFSVASTTRELTPKMKMLLRLYKDKREVADFLISLWIEYLALLGFFNSANNILLEIEYVLQIDFLQCGIAWCK
jgi:hypothetical protein